jgi:hypothetical protein
MRRTIERKKKQQREKTNNTKKKGTISRRVKRKEREKGESGA